MVSVRPSVAYPVGVTRGLPLLLGLWIALAPAFGAGCAARTARIPGPVAAVGRGPQTAEVAGEADEAPAKTSRRSERTAQEIVEAARHYLDHRPSGFRDDCSGYVEAVFARAGLPLRGSTASIYDLAEDQGVLHHRKEPRVGDLAFFDDTYDRNHNGKRDDPLSHIAVVLEVRDDGTILLGHGGTSRGRTTLTMNLRHADERTAADGHVLNDWLRVQRDSDPSGTAYLAGELWRAFATVDATALAEAVATAEQ